ncbi:BLOC-1-related complex subunit 8-like isoform X1 [Patiria miniata]|uniref:BLOC-1-related complex subunit 8 n=1 Tax=Patiria miniata TaxID=46514 RepID=A0A914B7A9_PATMI|nr:BLOC-1-related complex subunit 8-like isoform X1 [Patiria miniata]
MDSFGSQALLHASINRSSDSGDPEVEYRVKKVTEKFSECMHIVANEPSLAMFRIQEHIRKSLPKLAECKMELGQTQQLVQGAYYDVDYAIRAVSDIQNSTQSFASIENMLKDSITCKRQLNAKAQAAKAVKASRDSPLTLIKDETGETASTGSNT